jgi:hypothetical protein
VADPAKFCPPKPSRPILTGNAQQGKRILWLKKNMVQFSMQARRLEVGKSDPLPLLLMSFDLPRVYFLSVIPYLGYKDLREIFGQETVPEVTWPIASS